MDFVRLETAIRKLAKADIAELVGREMLDITADAGSPLRAIRHPLGFACLPICRLDRFGACVHVWPRDARPSGLTTSPYHCHSWDLLSYVLHGSVGNQLVELAEGTGYAAFEVRRDGSTDRLVATGQQYDVHILPPVYWSEGEFYELPAGHFHASAMRPGADAVTVVLGHYNAARRDITLGRPGTPDHEATRATYSLDETVAIARSVVERVAPRATAAIGS